MNPQTLVGPGTLIKASYSFYKSHWKILALIAIIPAVISYIGIFLNLIDLPGIIILSGLVRIVGGVLSIVMSIVLIVVIHRLSVDHLVQVKVYDEYRAGFNYFGSFLLVSIITGLAVMGSVCLFIIPGIIVAIFVAFASYALIIDGKKGFSAVTESYSLVRGQGGQVFQNLFVLGLIMAGIQLLVLGLTLLVAWICGVNLSTLSETHQQIPVYVSLIGIIIGLVVQAVLTPMAIIYNYRMYISLKEVRKPEVSVVAFKRWVIAFMIIAPIAFILLFMVPIVLISLNTARQMSEARQSSVVDNVQLQQLLKNVEVSTSTTPNK
jgi:hypothetical protein